MENIFLESYDVFKIYPANSGKLYTEFLKSNRRYQITRCYYIIVVDNVFLTYSHLMLYEECLYLLFSQNRLQNGDFSFKIKKSDLAKKFKTDITKSATETIKRFHEMEQVKISIFVKDKIQQQMNIIEHVSAVLTDKYSDLDDEITVRLNPEFVKLYRCSYLDKIEYLNSFNQEQGAFVRYFMQHELDGGVKSSAILDKMGVLEYTPFSRKKRIEQEISNVEFYYKNEKFFIKDGFVVCDGKTTRIVDNQNAAIELYEVIHKQININLTRHIVLDEQNLQPYYDRFGNFASANELFKILSNMELMLNTSLQPNPGDTAYFSHFFESVICKQDERFKIYIELSIKGFEYLLSKRANLDFYNVESEDYGLIPYSKLNSCAN